MDKQYKKGQKLLVALHFSGEVFEGEYQSGNLTRIDLTNVIDQMTGLKVGDTLTFYESEVESIKLLNQEQDSDPPKNEPVDSSSSDDTIKMTKAEYERLKELCKNYIYISVVDKNYLDAVEYLSGCENIGVAAIGSENGRKRNINLLVLSSWDQVYIFDVKLFRFTKFLPELKEILESPAMKKVVHNSRVLTDCLWHRYEVELKNVFDTQVADIMLCKRNGGSIEKVKTISECLNHYLNFPRKLLDNVLEIPTEKWEQRPIKDHRKISASMLAAYLITLKNYQESLFLKDFYNAVQIYSNHMKEMGPYQASQCDITAIPEEINLL